MADTSEKVDYSKIFSIVATLLLCAGIVSQIVYYSLFNIPITEFLSIGEILLLFTQDVIRYIIITIILFFISFLTNYSKSNLRHKRFFLEYSSIKSLSNRIGKYIENRLSSVIYYFFGAAMLFILFKEGEKIAYIFGLYFSVELFYFVIRFLLFENRRTLRLKNKLVKKDKDLDLFFTIALHFIFFIICWSLYDVQKVKYQQKYINVSFRLNSDTLINSDSTKFYIGQTEKYLFYFDSKKNLSTIYKKENIKEFFFGKINYFQFQQDDK